MSSESQEPTRDELAAALPPAAMVVRGQAGHLFHSTGETGYCFVPETCLRRTPDGRLALNEVTYLNSGWGTRNRRFGEEDQGGNFVFPDLAKRVRQLDQPAIRQFLGRLG